MKLRWDIHELTDFGKRIGNIGKFEEVCRLATVKLAKELQEMLFKKTPVKTGQLAAGWGGAENYTYKIIEQKTGYKIELINRVPYATSVNDGHYSHNQYNVGGDPYVVKRRKVPYYMGKNDATFVFGHFFVEKSILALENGNQLEVVLYKELEKWFRWCING
jgi:hypothetical protein